MHFIQDIDDVDQNNFVIKSGGGYPQYFQHIQDAIETVNENHRFDRLVISIDSEDFTKEEKLEEIRCFVSPLRCSAKLYIVVQHFCFETWALGNREILNIKKMPSILESYIHFFDVSKENPELLLPPPSSEKTRAQFAKKYLHQALELNEHRKKLAYTTYMAHHQYFKQVKCRYEETSHIQSFKDLIEAFSE